MSASAASPTRSPTSSVVQDDELLIERIFDAPRELVFEVWTSPAHLMNWWGPKTFTPLGVEQDFRVGGTYRYGMKSAEGREVWKTGVYQEIVPNERIVMTFQWEDGAWGVDNLVTVTFTPMASGRTLLRFHQSPFKTVEARDAHIQGWTSLLEKLTTYLETAP